MVNSELNEFNKILDSVWPPHIDRPSFEDFKIIDEKHRLNKADNPYGYGIYDSMCRMPYQFWIEKFYIYHLESCTCHEHKSGDSPI